ncbi:site-specific integrase [Mucilaginibacter sp.]
MKNLADMYSFSTKLWYDKRWVSQSGEASLYLQVTLNGKHKEFPLKLKWPVDKIDMASGALLPRRKKDAEVNDFNLLIMNEQSKQTEIVVSYRFKTKPIDLVIFAREMRVFSDKQSFVAYMDRQSKYRYATKEICKRTYQNAQSALQQMILFDMAWPFEMLTLNWMKKFRQFLINEKFEPGGAWAIIKNVKTYLKLASHEPLLFVDENVLEFKNPEPEWKTTFLSRKEVITLMELPVKKNLTNNQVRVLNAFLFQCFTGLRISDIYRVNAKWRLTDGFLDFIPKKNEKNRKWIHIPIMPMANKFIKNVVGNYFDLPNSVEYNIVLKQLANMAEINKNLTSHVGRHTFGHLHITKVGNLKALQENLGHANIKTTARYAHLDDDYMTGAVARIEEDFT